MVDVAKEMKRLEFNTPLMVGGATTSRIHTAVKIDPNYDNTIVHVADASKSVPVAQMLLTSKEKIHNDTKAHYAELRENHANRQKKSTLNKNERCESE